MRLAPFLLYLIRLLSFDCKGLLQSSPTLALRGQHHGRSSYRAWPLWATTVSQRGDPNQAQKLVLEGMQAFRRGMITESIELFDQAETLRPSLTPYLWQRGIGYYYADRFKDASRQFQTDVNVNPLDVEEIVWDIASQLRLDPDKPPKMMTLPKGQTDRRRIMVR